MSDGVRRAIVIFPAFERMERIAELRRAYDPLAFAVPPHITLVFPFASDLTTASLAAHVSAAVEGIAPFPVELRGITGDADEYLFLNVKRGNDEIITLHDRLYTGPLAPFLSPRHTFIPHVTVGRLERPAAFAVALAQAGRLGDTFTTVVREVAVYRIGPGEARTVELAMPLRTAAAEEPERSVGRVVAVSRSATHSLSKENVAAIRLLTGLGVEGDAHAGATVQHRSRVARDPHQPNLRQVHLIHAELHEELRVSGFDVAPGQMGENLTTQGIDLLSLPAGTRLRLGAEAVVDITGLRNPCTQLDSLQPGLMAAVLERDPQGELIRKAGVMAVVVADGMVRPGDAIAVELPSAPHQPLRPV